MQVESIDLLADAWKDLRVPALPCTTCAVDPYVEFNELFHHLLRAPVAATRTFLHGS